MLPGTVALTENNVDGYEQILLDQYAAYLVAWEANHRAGAYILTFEEWMCAPLQDTNYPPRIGD